MAQTNALLSPGIETVFFMPQAKYTGICASLVREVWALGGDVRALVSSTVYDFLQGQSS